MNATQAYRGHFLPKKFIGKRTLREFSTSGKRDNIVLIDVDSDDFGDVIVLDVPESFLEKFRNNHDSNVIEIDDEDDGESDTTPCKLNVDHSTTNKYSPTSATYLCGLTSDSESSSESDCSDCEVMEGSSGELREQWEKAFSNRRREIYSHHYDEVNDATTSTAYQPFHQSKEENSPAHSESSSESDCSDCEVMEGSSGDLREQWEKAFSNRRREIYSHHYDEVNDATTSTAYQPFHQSKEENSPAHSESSAESDCSDCELMEGSSGELRKQWEKAFSNRRRESYSHHYNEVNDATTSTAYQPFHQSKEESSPAHSDPTSQQSYSSVDSHEFSTPPISCKEQGVGIPTELSNNSVRCYNSEADSFFDQSIILTDRQKIKETDEYKRAMEEEWASRQQQLQRQVNSYMRLSHGATVSKMRRKQSKAEEAQRLRIKKRAEKMRIMDNERRQKQRLEEIRETRRKDEENLNLKDKLRAEIRKELNRLEIMCCDMVSLLRFLGVHLPPFPSPTEVQAAYKRACLKFHPDRLTSTDLRQQVEAEEKFKLISTMKEKFLK